MLGRLLLLFGFVQVAFTQCSIGVYSSDFNKCYLFVSELDSFEGASRYCRYFGGSLVSIKNGFENSYVNSISNATSTWIGLNDINSTSWTWSNSSSNSSNYQNWTPGQPVYPSNYQCAVIEKQNGRWRQELCSSARTSICQYIPNQPTSSPTTTPSYNQTTNLCVGHSMDCNPGYTLNKANCKCYKVYYNDAAFTDFLATCQEDQGEAVKIDSRALNTWLVDLVGLLTAMNYNAPYDVLIGLQCSSNNTNCTWADGSPLIGYSNFGSATCNANNCAFFLGADRSAMLGKWKPRLFDSNNNASGGFICQKDPVRTY